MSRRKLICLTPVKDEAWILDRFLKCASMWADHVILADQDSSDETRRIASRFEKVVLVKNESQDLNEPERQRQLISEARKIPGPKILIALDADEILSSNWMQSSDWKAMCEAPAGTVIRFQWANLFPDMKRCWIPAASMPFGFVDDGSEHIGCEIHSPRIPLPDGAPSSFVRDVRVLHYQYTDWERMRSKHRWYQAWELLRDKRQSTVQIYRRYHHMYSVKQAHIGKLLDEWLGGYQTLGFDMTSVVRDGQYRWDREVLEMFDKYGVDYFARVAIWDQDWKQTAKEHGYETTTELRDPRGKMQKLIHSCLERTQPYADHFCMRVLDRVAGIFYLSLLASLWSQ